MSGAHGGTSGMGVEPLMGQGSSDLLFQHLTETMHMSGAKAETFELGGEHPRAKEDLP